MADSVVVIGVGMMTAVGLSAVETAASVRAGTMRFAETSIRDHRFEPFTLAEVLEDGLAPVDEELGEAAGLTSRELRLLRLASAPLAECLEPLGPDSPRPGLILALPETVTAVPVDGPAFLARLHPHVHGAFDLARSEATEIGRAGGLRAIGRAARSVAAGAPLMLAGGLDTYRDLDVLGSLDTAQRVKSDVHLDGFIPGEGAGFVLLASERAAERLGLQPLARLGALTEGYEDGHLYSGDTYRGEGLAATIGALVQSGGLAEPVREVYSSMNGESHWAKEWSVAAIRSRDAFDPEHRLHHPADCFGDTGAACGALMVGLAALGMARGYRGSPALVYCSSDRGERAAIAMMSA